MTSNSEERRRRLVDVPPAGALPDMITVRGARQNNLQNIDIDVPLWRTVAVVGVSGSGKTSLAMGTLYAEGLQRLLVQRPSPSTPTAGVRPVRDSASEPR